MRKSTRPSRPRKPYPDFPLFPHATRRWAKKIRGKLHYFGPWDDPDAALNKYLAQRDDLQAGRKPRDPQGGLTIRELANQFLTSKKQRLESGELTSRTWADYYRVCGSLTDHFGKDRPVSDLRPDDFDAYRAKLAKTKGPVAIANAIVRARVAFKWAFDSELIDRPVRFGTGFSRPAKKVMRRAKREGGSRIFDAADIRQLIDAAGAPLKAMILLGINAGQGQSDLASLPLAALDLKRGWLTYPRPKTEVARRCPLWPETVQAVRDAIEHRPEAKCPADAGLVFLTQRGAKWIREKKKTDSDAIIFTDAIGGEFGKLLRRLGLKRRGSFYNLRHTFRTEADASKDQPSIDLIMGHTDGSMAEEYRERIDDCRLLAVVNVVRVWLWHPPLLPPSEQPGVA